MAINGAEQSVLRQQEYYRLKREVQSPGDIYEIDASTKAVYIGPDSDISEVKVQYFDPNAPNSVETAVVSINGPFVGRLDSMLKTKVPTTSQPGRLLVSPVDIVDPSYQVVYSGARQPMRQFLIPPQIDLMAALSPLPDIPQVRADKTFRYPSVPYDTVLNADPDTDGATIVLVPIYGRRLATVTVHSVYDIELLLSLVTLIPGSSPEPRYLTGTQIISSIPATLQSVTAVYRASDAMRQGYQHDATSGLDNITFFESDGPAFTLTTPPVVTPRPRGMADYLAITIQDDQFPDIESTRFVDLFIKISDRET